MSGPYLLPALVHRRHGRRHQQDAGVVGARRRLSAGRLRHGAADGSGGARARAGARRGAPAQSHPGGEDALHQAAQGALRRQHAVRQRRLSGLPGASARRPRAGTTFPRRQAAARAQAAISASGWRTASRAPGAGRSSPAWCGCRTPAAYRCSPAPPRSGRGSAPRWRRSAPASSACARDEITVVPGDTGGVSLGLGAFASRQTVTAGSSVLLAARAVAEKAKKLASHVLEAAEHDLEIADGEVRVVGAPQLCGQARRARAHSQGRARLRLPARHRARPRGQRQLAHRCAGLRQCLPRSRGRGRSRDRRRQDPRITSRCRTPES